MVITFRDNSLCLVTFICMASGMNVFFDTLRYIILSCTTSCLTTAWFEIYYLSFFCMSYCLCCIPGCCRVQTFDHPYIQDPEDEENFIEVDTRPPCVIWVDTLYTRLVVAYGDYWDSE